MTEPTRLPRHTKTGGKNVIYMSTQFLLQKEHIF